MHKHDHALMLIAAVVCVVGSALTVRIIGRLIAASGRRQWVQLLLSSLIGGVTVWSTHAISMLAFDPGSDHGYEPVLTAVSLVIAIVGMFVTNALFVFGQRSSPFLPAGVMFGLSVSLMHYLGMMAYQLPAEKVWDMPLVVLSVLSGAVLGVASYHRIAHPVTRYCWLGGAILMVLAICTMHFTGMGALSVSSGVLYDVPEQVLSDPALALSVMAVTGVVLFVSFSALSIEVYLEREAEEQLEYTAMHDPLTGLANREFLYREVNTYASVLNKDPEEHVAILTIDLDQFKQVNDLWGRKIGDDVIEKVALRLAQCCNDTALVARTGADDFVVLLKRVQAIETVQSMAESFAKEIAIPIEMDGFAITLSVSIGIAATLGDGRDLQAVIQKSDLAMYRAKLDGGGRICQYNATMEQENRDRLLLINDLKQAAKMGQLELVYQVQNDIGTLEPVGFEALLRWHHHERGLIGPDIFIPLAEQTGLISEIGLWVLRSACREAASWAQPLSIAVNVAPQQLVQPSFIEDLSDVLLESGLAPDRLELEVTEASFIDDQIATFEVMGQIKAMGVQIAIDDFGTGYSSLSALQAFPFDKIKIDRSFVQDVHLDHQRAAIVRATLSLGDALNTPVLAEGVECREELGFLKSHNCKSVQGFFFGKPMAVEQARQIAANPPDRQAISG